MILLPPPVPIGVGAAYRPAPAVLTGRPVGGLRCANGGARFGVHLELFARRRVVIVPAGIGLAHGCTYPARTREPRATRLPGPRTSPPVHPNLRGGVGASSGGEVATVPMRSLSYEYPAPRWHL